MTRLIVAVVLSALAGIAGAQAQQQSAEGLAAFHKAEIEKWWPIIKAANIKVE